MHAFVNSFPSSFTAGTTSLHAPSHHVCPAPSTQSRTTQITMKKGRHQRPLMPQRRDSMQLPEDGTPIFAIFVRTQRAKIWYPVSAVKGDGRAKNLVDSLKGGFGKKLYEGTLDKGIAQTVYGRDIDRFRQNAIRMYPQLKKYQTELEFGYKISAVGLDDQPTKVINKDMALPFFPWVKKQIDDAIAQLNPK